VHAERCLLQLQIQEAFEHRKKKLFVRILTLILSGFFEVQPIKENEQVMKKTYIKNINIDCKVNSICIQEGEIKL
jgi:hypothetical protein